VVIFDLAHGARLAFLPIWDLRSIRRRLAEMRLDRDAPPFTDDDPADPSLPPLPPLKVDLGDLTAEVKHFSDAFGCPVLGFPRSCVTESEVALISASAWRKVESAPRGAELRVTRGGIKPILADRSGRGSSLRNGVTIRSMALGNGPRHRVSDTGP
jgi:hypothetical protein